MLQENTVDIGETAQNELFHLSPQYFLCSMLKSFKNNILLIWDGLKMVYYQGMGLTHSHTMTPFDALGNKPFEKTVGKGGIARNEQFLLCPQCFLPV